MLILHIMIDDDIFELLSKFIINNYYLINIFNEGICITQNLNKTSNLSIFIEKKHIVKHEVNEEKGVVCESIDILKNLKITYDESYKLNDDSKIVNDCCNTCKMLHNVEFSINDIEYDQLNLSSKLDILKDSKFGVLISNEFNGILLKTEIYDFKIYINIITN